jgi:DNA polymerase-3 subunit delta'
VVGRLRAAVAGARPAHAYFVSGPAGVGKATLARAFTASLMCARPIEGDACDACLQCARVEAGTHPDVRTIGREEERRDVRTEDARDLVRWLGLRPMIAARKVAIVHEADCLNEHGQNALLKALEEPPGACVLLLLATQASLLLPTVRSRCQRITLEPLDATVVDHLLAERGVPADVRAAIVPRAAGSLGRALDLIDDPGAEARRRMAACLAELAGTGAHELSSVAQALGREAVYEGLETAISWYRDLLGILVDGPDAPVRNTDAHPALCAAAARVTVPSVLQALDTVCDTIRAVEGNANRVLALETMLLALRRLERAATAHDHAN